MPKQKSPNVYSQLIAEVFRRHYLAGSHEFTFERAEIITVASELGLPVPSNVGDVLYTFRYRGELPESIRVTAAPGLYWIIRPSGIGKYKFVQVRQLNIVPSPDLITTKLPDATPGLIAKYALNDEQALLAVLRYNRLVDIFTGLTCYSLQSHLRTTVRRMGQVETDEVYIGLDKRGVHYVIPVQAKGRTDRIGQVQIEQDIALCAEKFPDLVCRPIAAQFMADPFESARASYVISLFELQDTDEGIKIVSEKHYRLVSPDAIAEHDLTAYKLHSVE
jgi:hypothetical protein